MTGIDTGATGPPAGAHGGAGAYGLEFNGLTRETEALIGTSSVDDPPVQVAVVDSSGVAEATQVYIDAHRAHLLLAEGMVTIDRAPVLTVTFALGRHLSGEALVHPYLAFPAAVISSWLGRPALHAGAFVNGDSAVGVMADKAGGKSSTMACIARGGGEVLTDDLLVLNTGCALAGPRAVDLREDVAAQFACRHLGIVGARERWRISLPGCRPRARLRAIVALAWSDRLMVESLPVGERVRRLIDACALGPGRIEPGGLMELATLPMWLVSRPRDLGCLDEVVELMYSVTN